MSDVEDGLKRDATWLSPEEKRRSVFVPFCQPAEHKTAKTKGTGLGLVITKAIVECMGGKIDFESEPGAWTKFFFTVPLKKHVASSSAEQSDGGRDGSDDDDSVPFDFADDDPDDGDTEFGSGDVIKIHFERATNVTEELINEEMDEAAVDLLFTPAQLA